MLPFQHRRAQVPPSRAHPRGSSSALAGDVPGDEDADESAGAAAPLGAGLATLPDLLAPDAVDLARDHLRLDGLYARTLIVTGYPPTVSAGWLDPLFAAPEVLDVSLHLQPQQTRAAQRLLSRTLVQLQSSRLAGTAAGRLEDPETEVAYAQAADLRERLQRGEEKVLTASLYITVYGATPDELEDRTVRVETLLGTLLAQTRRATWQALGGLQSTLPAGTDALHARHTARTLDTSTLATLFPFATATVQMEGGALVGLHAENNTLVVLDPFSSSLFNYNQCVVATSGAGKSYTIKLLLLRSLPLGVQTVVVDPVGEYVRLARAVGGQVVCLSAGSADRINPLDLPAPGTGEDAEEGDDDADGPAAARAGEEEPEEHDAFREHLARLIGFLALLLAEEGQRLTPRETGALDGALRRCYAAAGITAERATHGRPAPTLSTLHATLQALGDPQGLASRLAPYSAEGSLGGLFAGETTARLRGRLVVCDLHRLEEALRPAAMYLLGQHIWGSAARAGEQAALPRPRRIIIDEAQLLTGHPAGSALLEGFARRGRRHFVGVTAISQDVRDFLGAPGGQALLTNSSVRLLLRQDESTLAALEGSLHLGAREQRYLTTCPRGAALLLVQGLRLPVRLEASPQEHRLCTTDPHEELARPRRRRAALTVVPPPPGGGA